MMHLQGLGSPKNSTTAIELLKRLYAEAEFLAFKNNESTMPESNKFVLNFDDLIPLSYKIVYAWYEQREAKTTHVSPRTLFEMMQSLKRSLPNKHRDCVAIIYSIIIR